MADASVVVEGKVKFRDGKKWKPRWCVMKKPSPVADRLQVLLFKDFKETRRDGVKPKTVFPLEGFYGIESFQFDKEANVMAVVCQKQVIVLAFDSREYMIQFEIKIRRSLGQEHQFLVRMLKVPHNTRLNLDLVRMHIHGQKFCLTAYIPPKILQSWQICDLRRFGSVEGKFCFEGGSKCGKGMGIHVALSEQAEEIAKIVHLVSQGRAPSCNSNLNKRSSQIAGAFDSVGTPFGSSHHGVPTNILVHSGDMENQDGCGCQKRHSISVMDYRRMASFAEKSKLISIENLERQRLLAMYDIPPKYIRKVESDKVALSVVDSNGQNAKVFGSCLTKKAQGSDSSQVCSHEGAYSSLPYETNCHPYDLGISAAQSAKELLKLHFQEDYHGYTKTLENQGNYQLRVIEDEMRMANDRTKRKEALQKLQREESSLQREITLLDEILQVCKLDEETVVPEKECLKLPIKINSQSSNFPSKCKKHLHVENKLCHNEESQLSSAQQAFLAKDLEEESQSQDLMNKIKGMPSHSKFLIPLPYINLSKYDDDGDKSNHVHLSCSFDKMVIPSGSGSSLSNVSEFKKVDSSHTQNDKKKLEVKSSSESYIAAKGCQLECQRKPEMPPPELPPKGPVLIRKNLSSKSSISPLPQSYFGSLTPPPLPARDRSQSLGSQGRLHSYDNAPELLYPECSLSRTQDSYLLMGEFQEESKHSLEPNTQSEDGYNRDSETCQGQLQVAPGGKMFGSSIQYMEMAGQFEPELKLSDLSSPDHISGYSFLPRPFLESKITKTIDKNLSCFPQPLKESNYMEMTGIHCSGNSQVVQNLQTFQSSVGSTPSGESSQPNTIISKTAMPFPNLLNFQKRNIEQKKTKPKKSVGEQISIPDAPKESFLARFIRRSSRDHKTASQSQENLTGSGRCASFLESSQSDQVCEPIKLTEYISNLKVGRQRSSSFPNRLSYQDANSDFRSSRSQEDLPPEPLLSERNRSRDCRGSKVLSLDESIAPSVEISKRAEPTEDLKRNMTEPLLNLEDKSGKSVATLLYVQEERKMTSPYVHFGESSKTDDEKLIELYQSNCVKQGLDDKESHTSLFDPPSKWLLPLPAKHPTSASEQAAEIARHVTSLPPFIPPKNRSCPSSLSPVTETHLSPQGLNSEAVYVEMKELPSPNHALKNESVAMDLTTEKDEAQDTLQVVQPVVDEIGTVWLPQKSPNAAGDDSSADPRYDSGTVNYSALVVSLDDLSDKLDALSSSSHESCDTHSIHSEETVRSSPASTILRPRSGKDYQFVERRYTNSESCTSSPETPYSPSSATVFSFESAVSSSSVSEEHNSYMNVDMTPASKAYSSSVQYSSEHHLQVSSERTKINVREKINASSDVRIMSADRKLSISEGCKSASDQKQTNMKSKSTLEKEPLMPERCHHESDIDMQFYGKDVDIDGTFGDGHNLSVLRDPKSTEGDTFICEIESSVTDKANFPSDGPLPQMFSQVNPPPEQIDPQLNYAEIDLTPACSASTLHNLKKSKLKKTLSTKPVAYATIDMVATNAVKKAGIEHALARDGLGLRRSVSINTSKTSAPVTKECKLSVPDLKMSTGSLGES